MLQQRAVRQMNKHHNAGIGYAMQLMLYSVIIAALLLVIAVVTTIVG